MKDHDKARLTNYALAGVAYLDKVFPEWAQFVDPVLIDQRFEQSNVLTFLLPRLYLKYGDSARHHYPDMPDFPSTMEGRARLGFTIDYSEYRCMDQEDIEPFEVFELWQTLNSVWMAETSTRRLGKRTSMLEPITHGR